jgi:glutathionylspermidine synthase
MASPLQAGINLQHESWLKLQRRAIFDFCKWDIQCEDHPVLARFPLLLEPGTASYLNETAEMLTQEALAAEAEILQRPEVIERLALPRVLRSALQENVCNSPVWQPLRVMRFDFHFTSEGWRISEVNADVPGGYIESSGWNALVATECPGASAPPATSEIYARAIRELAGPDGLVAFVHATAYSDDRQVMRHLAGSLSRFDMRTCLLSPSHLVWLDGRARICANFASGSPDAIVRFFPAEWLPNLPDEEGWKPYFRGSKTPLSNPGSAIVLQTKRFPLVWEALQTDLFTWRKLLPETREVAELDGSLDDSWILKPVFGRVGERIGIRGVTPSTEFQRILRDARRRPQEWIAQERFAILPLGTEGGAMYPCIGVFTIGGKAAGFYGRVSPGPIVNQFAQDVAVLIDPATKRKRI